MKSRSICDSGIDVSVVQLLVEDEENRIMIDYRSHIFLLRPWRILEETVSKPVESGTCTILDYVIMLSF